VEKVSRLEGVLREWTAGESKRERGADEEEVQRTKEVRSIIERSRIREQ